MPKIPAKQRMAEVAEQTSMLGVCFFSLSTGPSHFHEAVRADIEALAALVQQLETAGEKLAEKMVRSRWPEVFRK